MQCSIHCEPNTLQPIGSTVNYTANKKPANSSCTMSSPWHRPSRFKFILFPLYHCTTLHRTESVHLLLSQRQAPDLKKGFVTLMRAIAGSLLGPGIAFVYFQQIPVKGHGPTQSDRKPSQHILYRSGITTSWIATCTEKNDAIKRRVAAVPSVSRHLTQRWNRLQESAVIFIQRISLSLSLSRSPLDLICTSYCMILYAYVICIHIFTLWP